MRLEKLMVMASHLYWYTVGVAVRMLAWWFVPRDSYEHVVLVLEIVLALIFLWDTISDAIQRW